MKNQILAGFILICVFTSCDTSNNNKDDIQALIDTDVRFSKLSEEIGMKKAFLSYADSDIVVLRNRNAPIKGIQSLRAYYDKINDSAFKLTWEPVKAESSGNLGYTYGNFELSIFEDDGTTKTSFGNYVTVWKKQPDGQWRFVLDTGTEPTEKKFE